MVRVIAQSVTSRLLSRAPQDVHRLLAGVLLFALPNAASAQSSQQIAPAPLRGELRLARTDNQSRILLLVRRAHDESLIFQLRVELRHTPYRILELRLDDRFATQETLGALAREHSASAAVRVDLEHEQAELWIDRPDGDLLDSVAIPTASLDPRIDALRIAEALRAHGLDLGTSGGRGSSAFDESKPEVPPVIESPSQKHAAARAESPTPATASPKVPMAAAAARSTTHGTTGNGPHSPTIQTAWSEGFCGGLGIGIMASPGGIAPTMNVSGRVGYHWSNRWALAVIGDLPLYSQQVVGQQGSADLRVHSLGLTASRGVFVSRLTSLATGVGTLGHYVTLKGTANPGYTARQESHLLFSSFAVTSLAFLVSSSIGVSIHALAGATWSEFKLQLGDAAPQAHWGRPLTAASLQLDYRF